MRLFEAILDANHRAMAGDPKAGLHPAEFESELPIIALTCIDPRLNPLMPEVLGVPEEQFIWLRNAGNIITGPLSSTMRSLALACAIKGGKQIVIIGHTDCQVRKTTATWLLDRLSALGIDRQRLPDNLVEFFGLFGSERQNVIKASDIVRSSPLISPKVPVHGLLVDIQSGNLEWLVNGYQVQETFTSRLNDLAKSAGQTVDALKSLTDFQIGNLKFPDTKIGEVVTRAENWLGEQAAKLEVKQTPPELPVERTPQPPRIPVPPPLKPKLMYRRNRDRE